jgi:hypothetical protein
MRDRNSSQHSPCPNCDSTTLHFTVVVEEQIKIADALDSQRRVRDLNLSKTQAKRRGIDIKSGYGWWRAGGKFVYRYQEVNHKTDRYREFVIDRETGEVLRDCDEPLAEHR